MAIENQITPRKEVGRAVDYLSPSTQVQVGGGPQSFSVSASKSVAVPTPYVGRAAENTELLQLAESLGMFNKQINALSYVVTNKAEKQAEQQGKEDAVANTELAREIFKRNMDQATKDGLFPSNAHPAYRLAYTETAAKAIVAEDLPTYLEENLNYLASADSMEPIGPTVRNTVNQRLAEMFTDPAARRAAMESAIPYGIRFDEETRAKRQNNFIQKSQEVYSQNVMGLTANLALNNDDADPTQQMVSFDQLTQLQRNYDMRMSNPDLQKTGSRDFANEVSAGIISQVRDRKVNPTDGIATINKIRDSIKSGTGPIAGISEVADVFNNATATLMGLASSQSAELQSQEKVKQDEIAMQVSDYVKTTLQSGNVSDIATDGKFFTTVSQMYEILGLPFNRDEARNLRTTAMQELESYNKTKIGLGEEMNKLIVSDPRRALEFIAAMSLPEATREDYRKRATDRLNVVDDLDKIGGFNSKKGDLDKLAKDLMGIPDGMSITLLTQKDMDSLMEDDNEVSPEALIQVQELMAYGENEFRQLASDKLLDELRIDPTLKDPERVNDYTSTVTKAINDAKVETSKRMNERKNAIKIKVEQEEKAKTEQFGKGGRFVSKAEQVFKSFEKGEINSPNFQLAVNTLRNDAKTLASEIKIAPENEKGPLTEAYFNLISKTGIGIDAVLTGEKSGVKIPTERINWKTQPLYESRDEFENIRQEQASSIGQGGNGGSLVEFVIREEAGPDGSSFYSTPTPDYKQKTIGYGTKARGPNDRVTPAEARKRLEEELEESAIAVNSALEDVGLILSENEFNALISFHFNTGDGRNVIKKSGGDKLLIRNALSPLNSSGGTDGQYVHVTRTPDGKLLAKPKVLRGLFDRRQRELDLFDGKFSQTPASKTKYIQLLEQMGIKPNTPEEKEFLDNQVMLIDKLNFKP